MRCKIAAIDCSVKDCCCLLDIVQRALCLVAMLTTTRLDDAVGRVGLTE